MIKLLHEDETWMCLNYSKNNFTAILIVNKSKYLNPPSYNAIIGEYFPKSDGRMHHVIENGSFLKEEIDDWFKK